MDWSWIPAVPFRWSMDSSIRHSLHHSLLSPPLQSQKWAAIYHPICPLLCCFSYNKEIFLIPSIPPRWENRRPGNHIYIFLVKWVMFQYVSYTNIQILWLASADIWVCDLTYMRDKETQVKRKSIVEGTGTHTDTCSPQVQPFPVIPICSEMHPQTWMLGSAALLSPSGEHFHQEAIVMDLGGICPIVVEGSGLWLANRANVWSGSPKPPPHSCEQRSHRLPHILNKGLHLNWSFMRCLLSYTCLSQAISQIFW